MRLVRNTGDRLVILDRESDETMVMMNLDEYENLIQGGCDCDCEDDPDGEEWPAGDDDDEEEASGADDEGRESDEESDSPAESSQVTE